MHNGLGYDNNTTFAYWFNFWNLWVMTRETEKRFIVIVEKRKERVASKTQAYEIKSKQRKGLHGRKTM
jgi:hypothetical protein